MKTFTLDAFPLALAVCPGCKRMAAPPPDKPITRNNLPVLYKLDGILWLGCPSCELRVRLGIFALGEDGPPDTWKVAY